MAESASDRYARILLPQRNGYPLWIPGPPENLPVQLKETGTTIGDVGIITPDGSFSFLFNICKPADDPANCFGVPRGFVQVHLNDIDIRRPPDVYQRGSHVSSELIEKEQLNASISAELPSVPAGLAAGFEFKADCSEGAVLSLPEGASRLDLDKKMRIFREQAIHHGEDWYHFANDTLGCDTPNGSLYLVTGCDKTSSWGVASFSRSSGCGRVSLKFTAQVAQANASYQYAWQTSSGVDTRSGPRELNFNRRRRRSGRGVRGQAIQTENQTVFIRGFKIMLRDHLFAKLMGGSTKVAHIMDSKSKDILEKDDHIPFSGQSKSSRGLFERRASGGNSEREQRRADGPAPSETESLTFVSDSDVLISLIPGEPQIYHPSTIINKYLLDTVPSVQVAVTHDDIWCSVLRKGEKQVPNDAELLRRVKRKYKIVRRSESAFLVLKPQPATRKSRDTGVCTASGSTPNIPDAGLKRETAIMITQEEEVVHKDLDLFTSAPIPPASPVLYQASPLDVTQYVHPSQMRPGDVGPNLSHSTVSHPSLEVGPPPQLYDKKTEDYDLLSRTCHKAAYDPGSCRSGGHTTLGLPLSEHRKIRDVSLLPPAVELEPDAEPSNVPDGPPLSLEDTNCSVGAHNTDGGYGNQGRRSEAEKLEVQVVESRKRFLDEEHPNTLTVMGNLALTYWDQGRRKEAEKLQVEVMRKKVLGIKLPGTLESMRTLASWYQNQVQQVGMFCAAQGMIQQLSETCVVFATMTQAIVLYALFTMSRTVSHFKGRTAVAAGLTLLCAFVLASGRVPMVRVFNMMIPRSPLVAVLSHGTIDPLSDPWILHVGESLLAYVVPVITFLVFLNLALAGWNRIPQPAMSVVIVITCLFFSVFLPSVAPGLKWFRPLTHHWDWISRSYPDFPQEYKTLWLASAIGFFIMVGSATASGLYDRIARGQKLHIYAIIYFFLALPLSGVLRTGSKTDDNQDGIIGKAAVLCQTLLLPLAFLVGLLFKTGCLHRSRSRNRISQCTCKTDAYEVTLSTTDSKGLLELRGERKWDRYNPIVTLLAFLLLIFILYVRPADAEIPVIPRDS